MKNNKGVTLVILIITILIMVIISGTITYNVTQNMETTKLSNFYTDLKLLQDKISIYYAKFGGIPIKEEFEGKDDFKTVKNPNDGEKYYIIDLNAIENLTLNYKITDENDDVYVINEDTHTIYYPQGLTIKEETYYCLPENFTQIQE